MANEEIDARIAGGFGKAIDFASVGATVSEFGSAAYEEDGWIRWCGSDFRIFKWRGLDPREELTRELVVTLRELNVKLQQGGIG